MSRRRSRKPIRKSRVFQKADLGAGVASYALLEDRQLLAADISLQGTNLVITQLSSSTESMDLLAIKDDGTTIRVAYNGGGTFGGAGLPAQVEIDPHRDSFTIDKSAFQLGVIDQIIFDLKTGSITDVEFVSQVDLPVTLDLQTRGLISQDGPLQTGDLTVSGSSIDLSDDQNNFGTINVLRMETSAPNAVHIVEQGQMDLSKVYARQFQAAANSISIHSHVGAFEYAQLVSATTIDTVNRGMIRTQQLLLRADGDVSLSNSPNRIDEISGRVNGNLDYTHFFSSTVTRTTKFGMGYDGLTILGDLSVHAASNPTLNGNYTPPVNFFGQHEDAYLRVFGTAHFDLYDGVINLPGGDSNNDGINDNRISAINIVQANSANVVNYTNMFVTGANLSEWGRFHAGSSADGRLVLDGTIVAPQYLLLQGSTGVVQNSGMVATDHLLLGGDQANQNGSLMSLLGANEIHGLSVWASSGNVLVNSVGDLEIRNGSIAGIDQLGPVDLAIDFAGVNVMRNFTLHANSIHDSDAAMIDVARNASLSAATEMVLGDGATNAISIGQQLTAQATGLIALGMVGDFQAASLNANTPGNLDVRQTGDVVFAGTNAVRRFHVAAAGDIGMADGSTLNAGFASTFQSAGTIRLADTATTSITLADTLLFGDAGIVVGGFDNATMNRVQFQSNGDVAIHQLGYLSLINASHAANLLLESSITIRDAASFTLDVTGDAIFRAAVGASLADDATNVYHICGNTFFDVGSFAIVDEAGMVTMTSHQVKDLAFASIAVDSTVC